MTHWTFGVEEGNAQMSLCTGICTIAVQGQVLPSIGRHCLSANPRTTAAQYPNIWGQCELHPYSAPLATNMLLKGVPKGHSSKASIYIPLQKLCDRPWGASMLLTALLPAPHTLSLDLEQIMVQSQWLKPLWKGFPKLFCLPSSHSV